MDKSCFPATTVSLNREFFTICPIVIDVVSGIGTLEDSFCQYECSVIEDVMKRITKQTKGKRVEKYISRNIASVRQHDIDIGQIGGSSVRPAYGCSAWACVCVFLAPIPDSILVEKRETENDNLSLSARRIDILARSCTNRMTIIIVLKN